MTSQPTTAASAESGAHAGKTGFWALSLGALGVVYGDVGTSPLYAFKESIHANGPGADRAEVIGILSLILWTLTIIVTLKYVVVLLRADNQGEGGTLSLVALAQKAGGSWSLVAVTLGMIGASLFFGDAVVTPAISVLGAMEGLKVLSPRFEPYVVPLTLGVIVALFAAQSRGTAKVAALFGPIMMVWFTTLGVSGLAHISDDLGVFAAINPLYGLAFLFNSGGAAILIIGGVFLAATGAEALYADLGHFGRGPIRMGWLGVAFPCLALNYLGQGALVLAHPESAENPFYHMFPHWLLAPMVILATMAAVIASQAVITGAFSFTSQAVRLRLLPRLTIRHTSAEHAGQIYMPQVNLILFIIVIGLVAAFRSSSGLAAAYGIAVSGEMLITAFLAGIVAWRVWGWPLPAALALMAPFAIVDAGFFTANFSKLLDGGFAPLMISAAILTLMITWRSGSQFVAAKSRKTEIPLSGFIDTLAARPPQSTTGAALFLTAAPDMTPTAMLHALKHFRTLHEKVVILTVQTAETPRVPDVGRVKIEPVNEQFSLMSMTFGYMEEPNVPRALLLCRKMGWKHDIMHTSFFLSRRSLRLSEHGELPRWQARLYIMLSDNANDATEYFHLPTDRVVEIGTQIVV